MNPSFFPSTPESHSPQPGSKALSTAIPQSSYNHYLAVLRRKWWLILSTMLITIGTAVAYLQLRTPVFQSEAIMWVSGTLQLPDGARYTEDLQTFFGTQMELIQTDAIIDRAVKRLKNKDPKFKSHEDGNGRLIVPKIRIAQAPRSAVFALECRDTNGPLAQSFLEALMDEFLAYRAEVRSATSGGALTSVSDQLHKQEQELKSEQERLSAFQSANNIALLEAQVRDGGARLAQLRMQLDMTKLDLQLLDGAALYQTDSGGFLTNLLSNAPDPRRALNSPSAYSASLPVDFVTAYQQLKSLKVQRDQLSLYMKDKHPKIVKLNEEIALADKVIEYFRQQSLEQLNTSKQALVIRIQSLENAIKDLEARVAEANLRYADYDKIKANIQRLQGFEDRLLTLLQGVDINRNVSGENVTILEHASPPVQKAPLLALSAILMLGCMISVGSVMLSAARDDRFDSLDAVRRYFPQEIVGQIPEIEIKKHNKQSTLIVPNDPRHVLTESCRNLRSSLLYWPLENGTLKSLLVTSAVPHEGKSTVAASLARILAMGGARVLLVDGDLRCGSLHELLEVSVEPGLTELLAQGGDPKRFIIPTDLQGLSFIPRGHRTPDSADLFLRQSFTDLLAFGKAEYDYFVMDCVSVFAADDAVTIAPKLDGVLFVTRSGSSRAGLVRRALELLYQRQSKVLGLVFNRANPSAGSYHYYKYAKYHKPATSTSI